MPSFDISSNVDWQEVDNAINQTLKESATRFDFRGVETEILQDKKDSNLVLKSTESAKLAALKDILITKLIKRNVSLFAFEWGELEKGSGNSGKITVRVKAGIEKAEAKKITEIIKESGIKVKAKQEGDEIRVTGAKRDDLQKTIQLLKEKENDLQISMQYGNFRE